MESADHAAPAVEHLGDEDDHDDRHGTPHRGLRRPEEHDEPCLPVAAHLARPGRVLGAGRRIAGSIASFDALSRHESTGGEPRRHQDRGGQREQRRDAGRRGHHDTEHGAEQRGRAVDEAGGRVRGDEVAR
jgi:hypothetical protein